MRDDVGFKFVPEVSRVNSGIGEKRITLERSTPEVFGVRAGGVVLEL